MGTQALKGLNVVGIVTAFSTEPLRAFVIIPQLVVPLTVSRNLEGRKKISVSLILKRAELPHVKPPVLNWLLHMTLRLTVLKGPGIFPAA